MKIPPAVEAQMFSEIMLPVIQKHGAEKGARIMACVGKVFEEMARWPDDVRVESHDEMLRLLTLIKTKSETK